MSDIKVGDIWVSKSNRIKIARVGDLTVSYFYLDTPDRVYDSSITGLVDFFEPKPAEPTIAVDSVWRCKEGGELVYIESNDPSDLPYNLDFSPLGETGMYANNTESFLSKYEFVRDKVALAPDMSVAIGDVWQARCDGTNCKVMDIEVDEGVTWVTTQSVDDEDAVESDTLRDFFEMYRFIGRVGVVVGERDAINPDHYQSDPSGVQCIAISENWSFCLGNALKYMWRSGKKDSSKNIEDLQKAVWYIEREISRLDKDSE